MKARAQGEFEAAYRRLARNHARLANAVAAYMSQADLDRTERAVNAKRMAKAVLQIIGGDPVGAATFPECCLVGHQRNNGEIEWFCTGVLVHPKMVVTAAHAEDRGPNIVALNVADRDVLTNAEIIEATFTSHRRFDPTTRRRDVAVMLLASASRVAPAAIASASQLNRAVEATLAGFGQNDIHSSQGFGLKRTVEVSIRRIPRGRGASRANTPRNFDSRLEFIAGGAGFDACFGDSGGPAYIAVGANHLVGGITSRSINEGGPCGDGTIFSRMDVHLDFLGDTARANHLSFP